MTTYMYQACDILFDSEELAIFSKCVNILEELYHIMDEKKLVEFYNCSEDECVSKEDIHNLIDNLTLLPNVDFGF